MSKKTVDRLQNAAILLLTVSAAFLLIQTPMFGGFSLRDTLHSLKDRAFGTQAEQQSGDEHRVGGALPVRVLFSNDFVRSGSDTMTTADVAFEAAGSFFAAALTSETERTPVAEETFAAALTGAGLYLDCENPLPLPLLANFLGVAASDSELSAVRRLLLVPAEEGGALLYVQDETAGFFRCETALAADKLSDYLSALTGNGAELAGETDASVSPYTFLPGGAISRPSLRAESAVPEWETLLRRAGFNPHTENYYTDALGTLVVREGGNTLYVAPDGTVSYQGDAADASSAYFVRTEGETPTWTEAVSAAQSLLRALLGADSGDAMLYLSGAERTEDGYRLRFSYLCCGTPILFSDGEAAAELTIAGTGVTAFSLRPRRYFAAETAVSIVPPVQAAAIAAHSAPGAELSVAYVDGGGETVQPGWITDF